MRIVNAPLAADDPILGQQADILAIRDLPWDEGVCDEVAVGSFAVRRPSQYEAALWVKLGEPFDSDAGEPAYSGWRCLNGIIQIPFSHKTDPNTIFATFTGGEMITRTRWYASDSEYSGPTGDWILRRDGVNPLYTFAGVNGANLSDVAHDPPLGMFNGEYLTVSPPAGAPAEYYCIMTLYYTL